MMDASALGAMMDYFAQQQAERAGRALREQRAEWVENRGRTRKEVDELRSNAAKSAACCGECFRPLAPTESVTMVGRNIGSRRRESWIRVPICLDCTLGAMELHRAPGCFSWHSDPHWHRARCLNCGRPLRLRPPFGRDRWTPSRNERTCCRDCQRLARNKRNAERRRVTHELRTCANAECGKSFIPKRADAVTCSNRCRQALHRERSGVDHPLRSPPARRRQASVTERRGEK